MSDLVRCTGHCLLSCSCRSGSLDHHDASLAVAGIFESAVHRNGLNFSVVYTVSCPEFISALRMNKRCEAIAEAPFKRGGQGGTRMLCIIFSSSLCSTWLLPMLGTAACREAVPRKQTSLPGCMRSGRGSSTTGDRPASRLLMMMLLLLCCCASASSSWSSSLPPPSSSSSSSSSS